MNNRPRFGFVAFVLVGIASPSVDAQSPGIEHQAVGCVAAEKFPRIDARFVPNDRIAAARIVFQSDKTDQWWSVAMKPEGPAYFGVLPKPKSSLKAFRYYVEVTDKALGTSRTPDYVASVVGSRGECSGKLMATSLSSAAVVLQGPAGVATLPLGFASSGVIAGSSSATAAGGSAAAAGGGGISTGLIVGGVVVAAAGVAVAVVHKGDGGSGGSSYTGAVTGQRTVTSTLVGPPATTCLFTSTLVGTATVRLNQTSGTVTGDFSTTTTKSFIGATGGATCQGEGPSGSPNGQCKITGSAAAFGCSDQLNTGGTEVRTIVFSGGLSGGVVSGTVTFAVTGGGTNPYSGSATIPVTLR
ncbi:MAG: hypothetical protein ABI565_05490 [Vicinamibacteria bacterium]